MFACDLLFILFSCCLCFACVFDVFGCYVLIDVVMVMVLAASLWFVGFWFGLALCCWVLLLDAFM